VGGYFLREFIFSELKGADGDTNICVQEGIIRVSEWGVGDRQRQDGRDHQDDATGSRVMDELLDRMYYMSNGRFAPVWHGNSVVGVP
jgi:hypothetical protein